MTTVFIAKFTSLTIQLRPFYIFYQSFIPLSMLGEGKDINNFAHTFFLSCENATVYQLPTHKNGRKKPFTVIFCKSLSGVINLFGP
jgi:hypothetical protein